MSELRPLWTSSKTVARAAMTAVVLFAVDACVAAQPASRSAPTFGRMSDKSGSNAAGLVWQMLAAVLVVLVVGAAALYLLKRVLPRIKSVSQKRVAVLETAYLGSRKAVHLLQVGSRRLLVASSPDRVVRLDDVTEAFSSEYDQIASRVGTEMEAEGSE